MHWVSKGQRISKSNTPGTQCCSPDKKCAASKQAGVSCLRDQDWKGARSQITKDPGGFLGRGEARAFKRETHTVKCMFKKHIFGNDIEEELRETKTLLTENLLPHSALLRFTIILEGILQVKKQA